MNDGTGPDRVRVADSEVRLGAGVRVAVLHDGVAAAFGDRGTDGSRDGKAGGGRASWPLTLVSGAPVEVAYDGGSTSLRAGDLMLWDPARRATVAKGGGPTCATVLRLPPRALPIPDELLGRLAGRPVPSVSGPAAVLARFLEGVAEVASSLAGARTERLGSAAIDLAVEFLSSVPAARPREPQPSRQAEVLARLTEFIAEHLHDPDLSPRRVASAHHMSVRHLQYLFQHDNRTVGRYILEQRLRRCRTDLSDPALSDLSVGRIGSRWGFSGDAVFCRTFKQAYGLTPGEWRRRQLLSL